MVKNIVDIRNNKIIVNEAGFFGIDTTNPRARLHIEEGIVPYMPNSTSILQVASNFFVTDNKVGIGRYPKETLSVKGNIRIENDNIQKISFGEIDTDDSADSDLYTHDRENGTIEFEHFLSQGSLFKISNKIDDTLVPTFIINHRGAIGIGTGLNNNFGTENYVLVSNGIAQAPEWVSPDTFLQGSDDDVTFNSVSIPGEVVRLTTNGASIKDSFLQLTDSYIKLGTDEGISGQVLTSRGTNSPEWVTIPSGGGYIQDLNPTDDVVFNSVSIPDKVALSTNGASITNSVLQLTDSYIKLGTDEGIFGQVLTSRGTNSYPEWTTIPSGGGYIQDLNPTDDVVFNSVSIPDKVALSTNGASITNSVLQLTDSYIKLGTDEGISGQVLTSRGTNSPEWVTNLGGDLASGFYEPFGLGLTGGLETMVNRTIYFSAFYTSIAVNYKKIILYTSENFISFDGTLGIAIYSDNSGVPNQIIFSETISLDLSSPGTEIEISINFNLNGYTKYWLGIGSSSASGSLSLAKSVITNDGNLHIKSLPDLFTSRTDGSFFPGVITSAITTSPLNFWFRLYNPNIASFHELVDSSGSDAIDIYKSSDPSNIIEAKIETQTVGDTSADLEFKLLHDSTLKKRFSILSTGEIVLGTGANGRGTTGYVLTSRGAGPPEWAPIQAGDGSATSGGIGSSYPHSSIDQRSSYEANFRLASSLQGTGTFSTSNGDEWEIIHTDTTIYMPIPPVNERVHDNIFGVKLGKDIRYRQREAIRRVTTQSEIALEINVGTVFSIGITHASNHDELHITTPLTVTHPIIFSCWNKVGDYDETVWRPNDLPSQSNNRFSIFYHDSSVDNSRIAIEFGTNYRIVSNESLLTRTRVTDINPRVQHIIFSFDNATGIAYGSIDGEQLTFKYGYIDSTKYGIDYTGDLSTNPIVNMWPVNHIIYPDEVQLGLDPQSVRGSTLISTPDSIWGKIAIYNSLNLVTESTNPGIDNSSYEKYLLTDPYLEKQKNKVDKVIFAVRGSGSQGMNAVITGWRTPIINLFTSQWTSGTGSYTIPDDGNYRISTMTSYQGYGDNRSVDFALLKNSSGYTYVTNIGSTSPPGSPEYYSANIDIIDSFNQGDVLNLRGYWDSGYFMLDHTFWNITRIY